MLKDTQQQQVYDSETFFQHEYDYELTSVDEIVEYVSKTICIKQVRKKFRHIFNETIQCRIKQKNAIYSDADGEGIQIAPDSVTIITVLHELAHCLQFRDNAHKDIKRFAGHDSTFTSIYLFLVRFAIGVLAHKTLKEEFETRGVEFVDLI